MNNKELKALRLILTLEPGEAACHIGNKDIRTWQRWESGASPVPQYVINLMDDYNQLRDALVEKRYAEFHRKGELIMLNFYMTLDEFEAATGKRDVVMWRITNSVAGECYSAGIASLE
ncbi:hypothetical protein BTJ39_23195 [Izhakiella australiensis]|uniref:DUF1870 domain-containing protein n=1 Tax=Izhakiella australiensis TaxID=1926881 RepID=A0A1S8Y7Q7_9GAMM|nr:DUF1870 family protein [Izhakiella australiensis]OON34723.1 hypothetical protein BTJ39_23195 [Izhakiella australiensis]